MDDFPTLEFGPIERHERLVFQKTCEKGGELFREQGALRLKQVFSPDLIQTLYKEFVHSYSGYFQDKEFKDAETVGDRRKMISVAMEGVFNDPEVYANPFIYPLLSHLLLKRQIMGSFGAVVSLPGAEQQRIHRDMYHLWDPIEEGRDGENDVSQVPPYAITVIVPLVAITEETGATRMWLGSHLTRSYETEGLPYADPLAEIGDAILFDYRLLHRGLANLSQEIRPLLYSAYSQPWFRDCVNCQDQIPLIMSDSEFAKVPEAYQGLFERTRTDPDLAGGISD